MAPRRELAERRDPALSALGVIAPPPIHVQTPTFDGSLAMLFRCVREQKVDLMEVPLAPICEAYFAYLLQANLRDLDEAAAALTALAYLLERKAWRLLPTEEPEPEIEDAAELPNPTVQEYALAIQALTRWQEERNRWFFRAPGSGPDPYELPYVLADAQASDLARALERLLRRAEPDPVVPLSKPRRSLSEQMGVVLLAVSHEWKTLDRLVTDPIGRSEAVYWFLALLELIRLGQVQVRPTDDDVEFARA